jgi:hypothetical protein
MRKPKSFGYGGKYDKFVLDPHCNGGTVDWQPGDATRYLLTAKALGYDECRLYGAPSGSYLVVVSTGGSNSVSLVLAHEGLHHLSYIKEQLCHVKLSEYTITVYTALINLVLGNEEYGVELLKHVGIKEPVDLDG